MLLAFEIAAYVLPLSAAVAFAWGIWWRLSRQSERVRLFPEDPVPNAQGAHTQELRPASVASHSRLGRQFDAAFDLLGGDSPEAVIVLAAAARHDRRGVVPVPLLGRALMGLGRSSDGARRCLAGMHERGILELLPDDAPSTRAAEHLCPRAMDGSLLGLARVRVGDVEQPVNVVSSGPRSAHVDNVGHVAGDPGNTVNVVSSGPSSAHVDSVAHVGLPAESEQEEATLVMERVPSSARTLVSGYLEVRS